MAQAKLHHPIYDRGREVVLADLEINRKAVLCAISREALQDVFNAAGDPESLVNAYLENQGQIDAALLKAYEKNPDEQPLVLTGDFRQ